MKKYSDLQFENLADNHIPAQPVPDEIAHYYMNHGYLEKGIPLNADTCREIAKILDEGGE